MAREQIERYGIALSWEEMTAHVRVLSRHQNAGTAKDPSMPPWSGILHVSNALGVAVISGFLSRERVDLDVIDAILSAVFERGYRKAILSRADGGKMPYATRIAEGPFQGEWLIDLLAHRLDAGKRRKRRARGRFFVL